jgi:predicted nucleotidyltransferase component of viral defense system
MNLYTKSVSSELYTLLCGIMQDKGFETFILGGGTSLALRFGHRSSIDLDFFSVPKFDSSRFLDMLREKYENIDIVNRTPGSICAVINDYKIDFLHHPYPLISEPAGKENIRFLSLPDIAAMKVNAVTNRGSKKDFTDLLLLHEEGIQLNMALDFFCKKYGEGGRFLAVRSLAWFADAEEEPDPVYLNGWSWKEVRGRVEQLVKNIIR